MLHQTPKIDFKCLRAELPIERVLELLGWTPVARRGSQLRGPCPVHRSENEKSRSFSVNLEKDAFRCFGCGASGNQLDLAAAAFDLPLYAAARELCHRLGVEAPNRP